MRYEGVSVIVWNNLLRVRWFFFIISIIYVIAYFSNPATPGNVPDIHPMGWWGWFDQGKYLLSANAFSHLDFSPEKHFYPPLYPIIGAFFIKWSSGHPYFIFDLIALLWFSYVFIRVSDGYIPRWGGIALLFVTTLLNRTIFENYVIPWTSTLGVALLATGILGLVWLRDINNGARVRVSGLQVFFVAACLGLLVPTRPADAVVGGVIGLGLLIGYWKSYRLFKECMPRPGVFLILAAAGSIVGPTLFFGFNYLVFGSISGNYFQVASSNGFFPADLGEKFVSIWLDGFTLYGEPNSGLIERYPWLLFSLAGLVWLLFKGDALLRTVAVSIVVLFVIYLPYGDLLPNGLWRFLNIHYFKWTFPFFALFAVILIREVWISWRRRAGLALPAFLLFGVPILLLSLHLTVNVKPVSPQANADHVGVWVDLPDNQADFADFTGVSGNFTEVYFGKHRVLLDGKELKRVRDFRLLPMDWGVRLLFIRPVVGHAMEFIPDPRLSLLSGQLSAQIGTYGFSLGVPKPFRKRAHYGIVSNYPLGELIDFSQKGPGNLYTNQGWSVPEEWGRWTTGSAATIQMRLVGAANRDLELELVMQAYVSPQHPCQTVRLEINGVEMDRQQLCLEKGAGQPTSYKFQINRKQLRADGVVDIRLVTPDSVSPNSLGMGSDDRVLGVGVRSLRLTAR